MSRMLNEPTKRVVGHHKALLVTDMIITLVPNLKCSKQKIIRKPVGAATLHIRICAKITSV